MVDAIFFYAFALLTLGGGVLTITRRSAVHSALWLIVALFGTAGLFLLRGAEFLFVVQIVLYIGGVVLLILFVVMLVNLDETTKLRRFNKQWWIALAAVVAVGAELAFFIARGAGSFQLPVATPEAPPVEGNTEWLAETLFSEYLLPFEIASILLLVAVVGSVIMARKQA
jgi:NADH-quinone oxidoreductase subunit J